MTPAGSLRRALIKPNYLQAISRVLISAVFIVFGYIQFTHIGNYIANPVVIKVAGWTHILTPTIIAYLVASDRPVRRHH